MRSSAARRALPAPTEEMEQRKLAQYLDARGLLWCAVPNGGHRNPIVGARLKAQGVKPGVPDILIFTPPRGMFGIVGVAIELKRANGVPSDLTPEQKQWLRDLEAVSWCAGAMYGADDAIRKLEPLYGPVPR
jgi:hypothetical protein